VSDKETRKAVKSALDAAAQAIETARDQGGPEFDAYDAVLLVDKLANEIKED